MKENRKQTEDIFNRCLESIILDGCQADDCLPAGAPCETELKPLLRMVSSVRSASRIYPDATFRAHAGNQFRTALYDAASRKKRFAWGWSWRPAMALPLAAATLMLSGGGVLAASSASLPDSPLYGIKLAVEDIQLMLTPTAELKTTLYAQRADRRIGEIISLARAGNAALMENTVIRLENELSNITGTPTRNSEVLTTGSKSITGGFGILSPSTTTAGSTTQPEAIIPAPTLALPQGTSTPPTDNIYTITNAITDQALLKFLMEYADKRPAELLALLDTVPQNVRPMLEYVIQLTFGYQQALGQMAAAQD